MDWDIICHHPCASRGQAIHFIQEYLASCYDEGEGTETTCIAYRREAHFGLDASYEDSQTISWQIEGIQVRLNPSEAKQMYHFETLHEYMPPCYAPS